VFSSIFFSFMLCPFAVYPHVSWLKWFSFFRILGCSGISSQSSFHYSELPLWSRNWEYLEGDAYWWRNV